MEILHGVLNDVSVNKERSFFYLRDRVNESDGKTEEELKVSSNNDVVKTFNDLDICFLGAIALNVSASQHLDTKQILS